MGAKTILDIVDELGKVIGPAAKTINRMYGIIHKRTTVEILGVKGFLIWDYIIWNEISFQDSEGNVMSFFTSISDEKTEAEWNKLVEKFGV